MVAWVQPPHEVFEALGLELTFTSPPGVIVRVRTPRMIDRPMAELISNTLLSRLHARFPGEKAFRFLHDWSVATGYEAEARALLTSWTLEHRAEIVSATIVPPASNGALLRLGISTAALALRAVGLRLEMKDSLERAVRDVGVERQQLLQE